MRRFPRPRLLVSACLEFEKVRYDGRTVPCLVVKELMPFVDFIKVCPECEVGLGVPRDALRIVNVGGRERLIQPRTGRDVTDQVDAFADRFIASLPPLDGFLFKSGSPTIGFYNIKVYDHPVGAGVVGRTSGIFAQKILRHYWGYPIEDDKRILNRKIRDEFLTKIFIFAGFREAAETGDPGALKDFHECNKYLFASYNMDGEAKLGRALAMGNPLAYFDELRRLLANPRKASGIASMAELIYKRYENQLSSRETGWFYELITKFQKNKVSRDVLLETLELFAVRMSDWQIVDQTLFAPYPPELVPDADDDRDRDYQKAMSIP
ncbi:YbgA family protein [Methanocella sp. MCL-LM]|uniref:YbgA family protein n=1 Tax=Methanocella sp. MCL-LM TaxID=3412035 RepID=UPI003C7425AF